MAEPRINLNNYKSSGVYTVEIDASENVVLPLTTGRLIVGSSRVGPFNTVVLINDLRTLKAVFGEIDTKLEKAGSYFHRSIEVALREGPVFAMNVIPLDTDITDPTTNLDRAVFTTFNTESAAKNNGSSTNHEWPITEFFNRQRLWFAESDKLNKSKNLGLGDDYITSPGGFGITNAESNKILSFVNVGQSNTTIWVRKANVSGFDVTAKEWYASAGGSVEFPEYVHQDDFISDYFVEVIAISGEWTNYLKLSKDPIYKQFFDEAGLKTAKSADFFALREVKVINRTIGCLIPDFRDQSGVTVSVDRLVNKAFPTTGILCALDTEKLDLIDFTINSFTDTDVHSHRIDTVGHGFEDLDNSADDGGYDVDGVTIVDPTPLIDTLSYSKPADSELIFVAAGADTEALFLAGTIGGNAIAMDELYIVAGTVNYLVAMEGNAMYDAYMNGFLKTGDLIKNATNTYYIKVVDTLTNAGIKYIRINVYANIGLTTPINANNYLGADSNDYVKIVLGSGDEFKYTFDLTDTNFFTSYSIAQPNVLTLEYNPLNKSILDEYIKVNNYIKANIALDNDILSPNYGQQLTRDRLLRIVSVKSAIDPVTKLPILNTYVITTMAPTVEEVTGLDVAGNELKVYKGISNFVTNIKGQNLKAFKLRVESLPDGTAERLEGTGGILDYLFTDTLIPQALSNGELIDFRYVVDTYSGTISSSSKYQLAKLAAVNGQAMALLNAPSVQQFERSVDPSFIDSTNKLVSMNLISQGGNLDLNPSFLYKFAEEDVKGVPLSSYSSYHFPNLIVRSGSKNISVPQAAYISNLYVRKFKNGTPFLIVAGGKRGALSDPEIVGLEYDLTDDDRDYLEPVGFNLTVKRRGFGIILFSNNTAYQRINSALNNAHVRDNLSTIERDIEKILFNFLFDFNDEITRLRVRTIVENYLNAVVNAKGLATFEVIFDSSNNTTEVISANSAVIDIRVDFPRGIQKFINRITITRVGGTLSSDATGFIPSF